MKEEGLDREIGEGEELRERYRNAVASVIEQNLTSLRREYLYLLTEYRRLLSDGVENVIVDFECFRKEATAAITGLLAKCNVTERVKEAQPPCIFELEKPSNGKVLVMELKLIDSEESTKEGQ